MRDDIFKLSAGCACKGCGSPINLRLYGTDAGYDLFQYWLKCNNIELDNNKLFYTRVEQTSFISTCRACYRNTKNTTYKARWMLKTTGKLAFPLHYSYTYDQIQTFWDNFKKDVKNKKWLTNAYDYLKWDGDDLLWFYYFNDIYQFFHNDQEHDLLYELEEYDCYKLY